MKRKKRKGRMRGVSTGFSVACTSLPGIATELVTCSGVGKKEFGTSHHTQDKDGHRDTSATAKRISVEKFRSKIKLKIDDERIT